VVAVAGSGIEADFYSVRPVTAADVEKLQDIAERAGLPKRRVGEAWGPAVIAWADEKLREVWAALASTHFLFGDLEFERSRCVTLAHKVAQLEAEAAAVSVATTHEFRAIAKALGLGPSATAGEIADAVRAVVTERDALRAEVAELHAECNAWAAESAREAHAAGRAAAVAEVVADIPLTVASLVHSAHAAARAKGWHDGTDPANPHTLLAWMALGHSEFSEAVEDIRKGNLAETFREGDGKPEGLPSELADVVIRVADTCGAIGIDLEGAIRRKMAYNATRSHRHGGKAA
jgi:NTP pyrophosphatase (non-canonical NTP hydrolase)